MCVSRSVRTLNIILQERGVKNGLSDLSVHAFSFLTEKLKAQYHSCIQTLTQRENRGLFKCV